MVTTPDGLDTPTEDRDSRSSSRFVGCLSEAGVEKDSLDWLLRKEFAVLSCGYISEGAIVESYRIVSQQVQIEAIQEEEV